uniref:Uncharacterized protein n=1 Tax=Ditylenchus dipsaci TaxID=166011 RepID=A0A915DTB6_9BILA
MVKNGNCCCFPINTAEAGAEIKQLIQDKGIESLTSKIIRKHLEAKFNCQLAEFKAEIDRLTMEKIQEKQTKSNADEEESTSKNKKKMERAISEENDDMVSSVKRRRACVTVKQRREPASKKKKADPDAPNNRKGKSAFSRICVLSDVVKAMWAYFREQDLLDPKDRRMVILNDALKKVFTGKRIQAFGMMKGLKTHIKTLTSWTMKLVDKWTTSSSAKNKSATEPIIKEEIVKPEDLNDSDDRKEEMILSKSQKLKEMDKSRKPTVLLLALQGHHQHQAEGQEGNVLTFAGNTVDLTQVLSQDTLEKLGRLEPEHVDWTKEKKA